ncbi:FAD-dependent oxidoreductase [Leifsonia poae]|uniref:FAD-dependent oxidoreductase n=1 Tax=Leifsonia poae TaxID=110933 RepID=UPI001CBDBBB6|nr:FAD-dependent oxidoreductase [Leifsonia poae]
MDELVVDTLIIGWGKGGKTLAGTLGRLGRSVALVERSTQMYGGGCINIACVPTKDLVHSAEQRRPSDDPQAWFSASVVGRDTLVEKLRERNHEMLAGVPAVTLIDGRARFTGPHEVEVSAGAERLLVSADTIVINTGTAPARPGIPGAESSPRVHDSESIQHIEPFPKSLVVVGGGYVGLEFAGMFSHFGAAVTVVDRNEQLMPREDRDVADAVAALLAESGVEFLQGATVVQIDEGDAGASVTVEIDDGARTIEGEAVLFATGRRPVTADLGLDAAGIVVDHRGFVVVDERLRTSVPGVFAIGDVNGGPQFTYISLDDNRIVLSQLTGTGERTTADRVAVPSVTFLSPPVARVGLNEIEARASGRRLLRAGKKIVDIAAMPRPKIVGETHGLIKVIVDADTDLVVGATVFSVDAQEVINLIALAMRAGVTASELRDGIWTHPSSTEALNEVLGGLVPLR